MPKITEVDSIFIELKMTIQNGTSGHERNGYLTNGHDDLAQYRARNRPHPQVSYAATEVRPDSFFGKLRALYASTVLKTQLDQMKKQGSYDAFKLEWHPKYDVRRLHGAKTRVDGIPPSLFWESDVGKWIEAACYFLSSPDGKACAHASAFEHSIQELVDMIEKAQQPDGYLDIYFTVVDPEGRFKNFRDMHEMYNAGHLLEGALAHYHYTGSRQFLDVMIKYVDCFIEHVGPHPGQLRGYPGHPELELAVLRLYDVTKDPQHLAFGHYLLDARGHPRKDQGGDSYFVWEAKQRGDEIIPPTLQSLKDMTYNQSHLPLHQQDAILGHSVRAMYLTTGAADLGGPFLDDAKRLIDDAMNHKMYVTGGFGTEPRTEGFSPVPYRLPQSTAEGGCYQETCASIACMMTAERILSHQLDGRYRDLMERCLLNTVIGGGSLDGTAFAYDQKMATWGNETAIRHEWFEVCCCPPNLSRTLGMLGGYTWSVAVDSTTRTISVNVYLFLSASRTISVPNGEASIHMVSEMPWQSKTRWTVDAPDGWKWDLRLPVPEYAEDVKFSANAQSIAPGYVSATLSGTAQIEMSFTMRPTLVAPHVLTGQDTLSVMRGPISYVAESFDNESLDERYPHFEGLGIRPSTTFAEYQADVSGFQVVMLKSNQTIFEVQQTQSDSLYRTVSNAAPARTWKELDAKLTLVPWFARANRGGAGRVRTAFLRVD